MRKYTIILWVFIFLTVAILAYAHLHRTSVSYVSITPNSFVKSIPPLRSTSSIVNTIKPIKTSLPATSTITVAPTEETVISADEYITGNVATGKVYLSHNIHSVTPIASISKLFTTHIVTTNMNTNQLVTITQPMIDAYLNPYGINLGEKFTVGELIYPLLLQSNNNIAEGLAMTYGYDDFIKKLNDFAVSLKMNQTHFMDASGLSPGNISTASDLFIFAQYLYKNEPTMLAITRTSSATVGTTTEHGAHTFLNIDPFVGDPHLIGGKTGRTINAGETMLSMFNIQINKKNYPIAIIVLHADQGARAGDSEKLLFQTEKIIAATK